MENKVIREQKKYSKYKYGKTNKILVFGLYFKHPSEYDRKGNKHFK